MPADELASAQAALAKLFPSAEEMRPRVPTSEYERWRTWDAAWPEFPFRSRSLNGLVVSDVMIDLAEELLGTDDVRLYLAIATAKYAGQPSEYNQLLHTDFPNHTLTVPRPEPGYHQMETFVYLNDVGPHNGATRFVSRTRTRPIPVEQHTLSFEEFAELYDDPADASAPAGSIVVYRPDVYHRSVDFTDPAQARFMLHVVVQARRRGVGRLPGVAVQGVLAGMAQLRPAGHAGAVDGARLPGTRPRLLDRRDAGRGGQALSRAGPDAVEGGPHRRRRGRAQLARGAVGHGPPPPGSAWRSISLRSK